MFKAYTSQRDAEGHIIVDPTRQREIDGLLEAAQTTGCRELFILTLEEEEEINVSEYTIHVLPVWKWMLKTLYLSPKQ